MARVKVYPFRVYDINKDDGVPSRRMGTLNAIEKIHGAKAVMEGEVEINDAQLDPGYTGLTPIDFRP
jgi:hypothetical protein